MGLGFIWRFDLYGIDMDLYGIGIYMGCMWDETVNIYVYTVYIWGDLMGFKGDNISWGATYPTNWWINRI